MFSLNHTTIISHIEKFLLPTSTTASTPPTTRRGAPRVPEEQLSVLFRAVIDATEEAIINSLLRAQTLVGRDGHVRQGIPVDRVAEVVGRYHGLL